MGISELIVGPIYIALAILLLFLIRPYFTNPRNKPLFIPAFLCKIFGLLFFTSIYEFYYGGGDTFTYFEGAVVLADVFWDNPWVFIQGMFTDAADYSTPIIPYIVGKIYYFRSTEEWAIIRLSGFLAIFSFKSYLGISTIMSLITFFGMWRLYNTLSREYPEVEKTFGIFILFAPSTFFWGSTLMKDTVALCCTCYIASCVIDLVNGKGSWIKDSIIIFVAVRILLLLKVYLLICFVPAFGIWWIIRIRREIKSLALKVLLVPFLILLVSGAIAVALVVISAQSGDFNSVDRAEEALQGYHFDHGSRKDASTYTLGEIEYTALGILKKAPESIIVTLFRPFPFEIRNVVMLLASLESTIYLLFTIFVFAKRGAVSVVKNTFSNPLAGFSFVFTVILGFIVGLSSYNFGALVRFKIPLLPFYGAWLVWMYYLPKYEKRKSHLNKSSAKNGVFSGK
ncbi:MAG: hypothetical protein ACI81T_000970 [Bacteroidia bacterium]|jgi:hypothetical protein